MATEKRRRPSAVHFYEWYVDRWSTSETRDELDACGRGIYREMLDRCYVQGSVTADQSALCRMCAAEPEDMSKRWPTIVRNFTIGEDGRLYNRMADEFRTEHARYLEKQAENGALGGRPKNQQKPTANPTLTQKEPTANPTGNPNKTQTKAKPKPEKEKEKEKEEKSVEQHGSAESIFEEIWTLYPKKGRLNRTLAEQALCDLLIHSPEISETILAPLRPGGKWASSKQWSDGFVVSVDKYIRDKRWLDEPEQANGSGSSDLPDLSHRKPEDIW